MLATLLAIVVRILEHAERIEAAWNTSNEAQYKANDPSKSAGRSLNFGLGILAAMLAHDAGRLSWPFTLGKGWTKFTTLGLTCDNNSGLNRSHLHHAWLWCCHLLGHHLHATWLLHDHAWLLHHLLLWHHHRLSSHHGLANWLSSHHWLHTRLHAWLHTWLHSWLHAGLHDWLLDWHASLHISNLFFT